MQNLFLLLLAIIPPLAFLLYVMHMDRQEPEPWGYIMKVLLLGGLACIPAGVAEYMLGTFPFFRAGGIAGAFIKSFLLIAPVEEAAKLLVVLLFVWKNKNFNEENDGVVYVGTAAIGFAMAENVMYVLQHGLPVGFARALTAIPLHTFSGVIMGFYVGIARFTEDKKARRTLLWKGFLYALAIHGLYDTFALSGSVIGVMILPMVAVLFIVGIRYMRKGRGISLKRWVMQPAGVGATEEALVQPRETVAMVTEGDSIRAAEYKDVSTRRKDKPSTSVGERQSDREPAPRRRGGVYKIVISRLLLGGCIIFWVFLSIGYFNASLKTGLNLFEYLVGGAVLTFVPIMLGIALEVSYWSKNRS